MVFTLGAHCSLLTLWLPIVAGCKAREVGSGDGEMGGLVNFQLSCQLYRQFHGQVKVLTLSLLLTVTVTVTKHWVKYNEQHSILHVFFLFPFIEFHYEESSASRGMFSYCVKPILQEDKLAIKYLLTLTPLPPPLSLAHPLPPPSILPSGRQ